MANTAPDCSAGFASPNSLWPPRHEYAGVQIEGINDPEGGGVDVSVQCIMQDEPLNSTGDGNFEFDGEGVGSNSPMVLRERKGNGNGNGRVYHISYIATDQDGWQCGGIATVSVPKSKNKPAIDDGALYDSVPNNAAQCDTSNINNPPQLFGQDLQTDEDTPVNITVEWFDPDLEPITVAIVEAPLNGNVSGEVASWVYIPNANFSGSDSFTIIANDGRENSAIATVNIEVLPVNDAPVAQSQILTLNEDSQIEFSLEGFDIDADTLSSRIISNSVNGSLLLTDTGYVYTPFENFNGNDSLSFSVNDGLIESAPATISIDVLPVNDAPIAGALEFELFDNESVAFSLPASDIDSENLNFQIQSVPSNGVITGTAPSLTYTPTKPFEGIETLQYRVNDGELSSQVGEVTLLVARSNTPPTVNSLTISTDENTSVQVAVSGTDAENDSLIFSIVETSLNGVATIQGDQLTYIPNTDFFGTDSLILVANDGQELSEQLVVPIVVNEVNSAPVATDMAFTVDERSSLSFLLEGEDVDGDDLEYVVTKNPSNGTISGTPPVLVYAPSTDFVGTDSLEFYVSDGSEDSGSATVTITVVDVNDQPEFTDLSLQASEDIGLPFTLNVFDPDSDELIITVDKPPLYGTLIGDSGNYEYQPILDFFGTDEIGFSVSDGELTDSGTVFILVDPVNDVPVAYSGSFSTSEDVPVDVSVISTDVENDQLTYELLEGPKFGALSGELPDARYTPDVGFSGSDKLVYVVSDESTFSEPATIEIIVEAVNEGPTIFGNPDLVAIVGTEWSYIPEVEDPDGDEVAVELIDSPVGTVLDHQSGRLSWNPTLSDIGNHVFLIEVTDPLGVKARQGFEIEVVDGRPDVTHEGTEFWFSFMKNYRIPANNVLSIYISAEEETSGVVEIPALQRVIPFTVSANSVHSVEFTDLEEVEILSAQATQYRKYENTLNSSIRIQTDKPVTVSALNRAPETTDGFLVLPVSSLGKNYQIASVARRLETRGAGSQVAVVATEENTEIELKLSHAVITEGTSLYAATATTESFYDAGSVIKKSLNRGDVYYLNAYVAGSLISSNKPVAVFSGNTCVRIPYFFGACDHVVEQMPPSNSLGSVYFTHPLSARARGDTFQVYAAQDNTIVTVNGIVMSRLSEGRFIDLILDKPSVIKANHPILVTQSAHGSTYDQGFREPVDGVDISADPFMAVLTPSEQFLDTYRFTTPTTEFRWNFINITIQSDYLGTLQLDGNPVDKTKFSQIGDTTWMGGALRIASGEHTLIADGAFGLLIYGYDKSESYAYSGGASLGNSEFVSEVNVLSSTEGTLGIDQEFCLGLEASDSLGNPVAFAPMPILVSGVNSQLGGVAMTDVTGKASFCFSGELPGIDSLILTLPNLTKNLADIMWETGDGVNRPPVFGAPPDLYTTQGATYSSTVQAIDPEGGVVNYEILDGPTGLNINSGTGELSWSVPLDSRDQNSNYIFAFEDEYFTVRATDDAELDSYNTYRLSQSNGNTPPNFSSPTTYEVTRYTNVEKTFSLFDPNRTRTTYSNFQHPYAHAYIENGPGSLAYQGFGKPFEGIHNGAFRWNLRDVPEDTVDVDIYITDFEGGVSRKTVTFTVLDNKPPYIESIPPTVAYVGREYSYNIKAVDPEGVLLTYLREKIPAGMYFRTRYPLGGNITWTPKFDQIGDHEVIARIRDSAGHTIDHIFTISVLPDPNSAPQVTSTPVEEAYIGSDYVYQFTASDVDGDVLTYVLNTGPVGMVINSSNGLVEWEVEGSENTVVPVKITVKDQYAEAVQEFDLVLQNQPENNEPAVINFNLSEGASISGVYQVTGSVSDDYQSEWSLSASRVGSDSESVISFGTTPIDNELLGAFDTTLVRNGIYALKLIVVDEFDQITESSIDVVVDGNDKVGNFSISFSDLSIPIVGLPVEVSRTYDSRRRGEDLDFGHGWSVDYQNVDLQESRTPGAEWQLVTRSGQLGIPNYCVEPIDPIYVSVTLPDDSVEKFLTKAVPECNLSAPILDVSLGFEAQSGTTSTLIPLNNSAGRLNQEKAVIGDIVDALPVDPSRYTLTTKSGYIYTLNQEFGIETVQDPNGNTLTYSDNGIFHSAGKSVQFTRDASGRIVEIEDPAGNLISYAYDSSGDLIAVTDRAFATVEMTYDTDHGLVDIIDPLGNPLVKNIYNDEGRLIAQEDDLGNRTEFDHDIAGRQSVVTDRLGRTTLLFYDERGNVTAEVDALGGTTTRSYNANDNQLSETNALGHTTTMSWDDQENQLTQTDPLGNTVSFAYNALGYETQITDELGRVYNNTYDNVGNLLIIEDPNGNTAGNNINAQGLVTLEEDMLGNRTTYEYDSEGNKTKETDATGAVTTYTYDSNNNQLTETLTRTVNAVLVSETSTNVYNARDQLIQITDALGNITQFEYDLKGLETAQIDARGQRTEMAYDAYGRLTQTTYADGTSRTHTYDVEGNKLTDTDRLGRTTTYTYDGLNRVIKTVYPDGAEMTNAYDAAGRMISSTDPRNNTTNYEYDAANRRTAMVDALGNRYTFSYDAVGNTNSETDARDNTVSYTYNDLDQRTQVTYPDAASMQDALDALGRRTQMTDEASVSTGYGYDELGRLTQVTDAAGNLTSYTYDEAGNKLTQTDAEGRTTRWAYDALGRQTSRTLPLGQSESFQYDANSNRIGHTDFNGNTHTFAYDNLDRMTSATYADGSVHSYVYDAEGNRTQSSITDANGTRTWSYSYDNRNRLTQETKSDGSTLAYQYDAASNKTQLVVTLANGDSQTIGYTYDALNRLETVTNSDGTSTSTYGYDEVGNRTSLSYPNGTSQTWNYDNRNRLTKTSIYNSSGVLIQSFDYTLHPTGRRTRITELDGRISDYTYNNRYWLMSENITDAVNGNYSASYVYDNVGNRTQGTEAGVTTGYSYDDNDRIVQQGGVIYSYDANGNTLEEIDQGVLTNYLWNSLNQLAEHTTGGVTTQYEYNSEGVRHSQANPVVSTEYLVDSNRSYVQVLAETVDGATDVVYHFGDDLISQDRNSETHYFHVDALGSTRVLTDATGNSTDSYAYEAFGEVLDQDGSTDNNYLYTGEQYDEGIGQYYLRARYYDQAAGRFSRMDNWMGSLTDPITLNKYLYGNADPIVNIDPTGLFSLGSIGAAQNIRSTLSTRAGVSGFRSAVNKAVGATLKKGAGSSKQALRTLRQCIKKKDKCDLEINLLIVGSDNDEMKKHIEYAQRTQFYRTVLLNYTKKPASKSGWYKNTRECKQKPAGTDCDEYPMRTTTQGGKTRYNSNMVSLRGVSPGQNRSIGGYYGFLSTRMENKDKFVVITSNVLPSVALPIK